MYYAEFERAPRRFVCAVYVHFRQPGRAGGLRPGARSRGGSVPFGFRRSRAATSFRTRARRRPSSRCGARRPPEAAQARGVLLLDEVVKASTFQSRQAMVAEAHGLGSTQRSATLDPFVALTVPTMCPLVPRHRDFDVLCESRL